jgi:DNA-binding CsgD family transcriptional regulator
MDKASPSNRPADRGPSTTATAQRPTGSPAAHADHAAAEPSAVSPVKLLLRTVIARETEPVAAPHVTADVLAFLLNIQSAPSLVVDRNLRIIFANPAAETALKQGGSLRRQGHDLVVQSAQARPFADHVDAAGRGSRVKHAMILEGGPGRPDMAVWFRPIDPGLQTTSPLWSRGLISISIRMLSRPPVIARALLREHYKLTVREAEVASRLALVGSLAKLESDLGIKITTLRSHLSKIFRKTRTEGQAELVALVLSLTAPVLV